MGRNLSHTQDEVFAAAERLAAKQIEVTATSLRAELGDRGSFSTLRRQIEEWKATRTAPVVAAPIQMPESVTLAFQSCWVAVQEIAAREIAEVRKQTDEKLAEANHQLAEALAEIERLESEAEGYESKLAEQTEQIKDMARQISVLEERNRVQQAETEAAQTRALTFERKMDEQAKAHSHELMALMERHSAAAAEAAAKVASAELLAEGLNNTVQTTQEKCKQLESVAADRAEQLLNMQQQLAERDRSIEESLKSFERAKAKAKEVLAEAETRNAKMASQLSELTGEIGDTTAQLNSVKAKNAELIAQNEKLHATLKALRPEDLEQPKQSKK